MDDDRILQRSQGLRQARSSSLPVLPTEIIPRRQGELFTDEQLTPGAIHRERERSEALMRTLDAINARFGRDMLRPLSAGLAQPWRMKQAWRSPRYTTRWDELAEVQ